MILICSANISSLVLYTKKVGAAADLDLLATRVTYAIRNNS
jgi:hypothetical protein